MPPNLAGAGNGSALFTDQLRRQLIDGAASAVVRSAINGTSLRDELKHGLANALLNTVAAQGAFQIGEARLDAFTAEVAHAILGCAVGAGRAGSSDGCAPGAVGAVVGHLSGQWLLANGVQDPATVIAFGQLAGGIAGVLTGGDVNSASIAAMAGGNVVENNECQHTQMCGSNSTRIEIQGNIAAGALGTLTTPDSTHVSVSISDGYAGFTVFDGQPQSGILSDALNSTPQFGVYCRLCLNSNIENGPKHRIVWGPHLIAAPDGQTNTTFANSLIHAATSYHNGTIPYSTPMTIGGHMGVARYNSNSRASGLFQSAGSTVTQDFHPYIAPGYQNPFLQFGTKINRTFYMTFNGWDYPIFLPLLIALLLFVFFWGTRLKNAKTVHVFLWALVLWLMAFSAVLIKLHTDFQSTNASAIRNYFGYLLGGALVSLMPFILITIIFAVSKIINISFFWIIAAAIFLIFLMMLFFPPFFFFGSLVGCVMSGRDACM